MQSGSSCIIVIRIGNNNIIAEYNFRISTRSETNDFLGRKYMNFMLTEAYLGEGYTYVVSSNVRNEIVNIFCVKEKRNILEVENSFYFTPSEQEIYDFSKYVWEKWPRINRITFNTLLSELQTGINNATHYLSGVDNIAHLPDSFETYLTMLGKQTCKHSKYYLGRIKRDFPSYEVICCMNSDIMKEDYQQIVSLSRQRMEYKNKPYGGGEYEEHLYNVLIKGDTGLYQSWGG